MDRATRTLVLVRDEVAMRELTPREDTAPPSNPKALPVDPIELLRGIAAAATDALLLTGVDPGGDEEGRAAVNRSRAPWK